jgi:predicted amidohydrolase YtcJ
MSWKGPLPGLRGFRRRTRNTPGELVIFSLKRVHMSSLLIHNAKLLSFHPGFRREAVDALIIEGDRIRAVGRMDQLSALAGPTTDIIDANGRTVAPGLHDTHIHVWKVGNLQTYMLDVRGSASLEDLLTSLEEYQRLHPEVSWVTARGFNEAAWKEGRMPTKSDLDRVISDKPVYLVRTCAHIAVCNSRALEIAGITSETRAPEGGVIALGTDGRPNGILSETALGLVTSHMPAYNKEELKTMVRAAVNEFYRYGITSATDPAVDPVLLEAYYEMARAGELGIRLQAIPILLPDGGSRPFSLPEKFASPHLSVDTVKFFSDGGLSGRTAALKRGYKRLPEDSATAFGVLRLEKEQYLSLSRAAQEKGLGIATHAIGDAAIELVTGVYRQLRASFPSGRLRIVHLGLPEEGHLGAMVDLDIATSMQTIFISELGKNFIKYLDDEYLGRCYPVRSVLEHGILTALSSDAPVVTDFNPFKGMEAAVTRKDNEGRLIGPSEGIGIEQALTAYTASAAAMSGVPDIGSLRPGNYADLIFLDRDPLSTPAAELAGIRVERTFVGGRCVWDGMASGRE